MPQFWLTVSLAGCTHIQTTTHTTTRPTTLKVPREPKGSVSSFLQGLCHWVQPLGRRAGGPPRRRVSELTSHRAHKQKETELASSDLNPRISPDTPRACGIPTPPCSPPLVARSLTRLAIRSGQSHPGLLTQAKPARPRLKSHCPCAIRPPTATGESTPYAVCDSPSDVATCHCLARRRARSPVTRHRPAIDASGTSASRAWDPPRSASPGNRTRSYPQGPSQAR